MKCGACGSDQAADDVRDFRYVYGDKDVVIPALKGRYCPDCEEILMDGEQADRYGDAVSKLRKEVNSAVVDPEFVASVRVKLGLSQEQAAELFGQPIRAFYRYESAVRPVPVPLVQLLTVLGNHPELVTEIPTVKYPDVPTEDWDSCCTFPRPRP
ncbi:type II TA system antitoxin MqsA family protein [Acidovorax sp.]|uniref:type II TA system antitoxin MqsA family protein n=1 Tax=Acidovorax sp. TaxID=1872122 RepID=UPI003CFD7E42